MADEVTLWTREDHDECMAYVMLFERDPGMTNDEAANELGISVRSLYYRISSWKQSGLLDRVRGIVSDRKMEAIELAILEVVGEWPSVILRQLDDAVNAKRPNDRRQAAKFLAENVIVPWMQRQPDPGTEEKRYVEKEQNFNPMEIPVLVDSNDENE